MAAITEAEMRRELGLRLARELPSRPLILDAGCGQTPQIQIPGARIVGLDLSEEALALNESLEDRLLGDVQSAVLPSGRFDAAVCWNVLEHLSQPEHAIENLSGAVRPGGLIVLGYPDPAALKGLVTKLTPHRVHLWVYRRLLGSTHAGLPGYAPFRTYLRLVLRPRRLRRLAALLDLEVLDERRFDDGLVSAVTRNRGWARMTWRAVEAAARLVHANPNASQVAFVLRRPGFASAMNLEGSYEPEQIASWRRRAIAG